MTTLKVGVTVNGAGENVGPDGYVLKRVRVADISWWPNKATLKDRISYDPETIERYARYQDLIANGAWANGIPIVYRTPKGTLIASDLRHSDLALWAELRVDPHPSVNRKPLPERAITVKIIEVPAVSAIPACRAEYLEKQPKPKQVEMFNLGMEAGKSDASKTHRTANPFENDADWKGGYVRGYEIDRERREKLLFREMKEMDPSLKSLKDAVFTPTPADTDKAGQWLAADVAENDVRPIAKALELVARGEPVPLYYLKLVRDLGSPI